MLANKTNQPKAGETAAKMLFIDHEKSPSKGYFWGGNGLRERNIIKVIQEGQVFCTSWSWLHETKIDALALPMLPSYRQSPLDNSGIIKKIHSLYEEADIIVGHNLVKFDNKESRMEFMLHDLLPPPPHKTIDTLRIAWDKFHFTENSLGALGRRLGLGGKVAHEGFEMWEKCLEGSPKAWKDMVRYNIGDVSLLKKIYFKFRPWITNHPAMRVRGDVSCPTCGSKSIESRGFNLNRTGRIPRYQCRACGAWSSGILVKDLGAKSKKKWIVK